MARQFLLPLAILLLTSSAFASDKSSAAMVMVWPNENSPVVKLYFGKLIDNGSSRGNHSLSANVEVENAWGKPIRDLVFSVYLLDKAGERIGEGSLMVQNLGPNERAKMNFFASSIGLPVSMRLVPETVPPELREFGPPRTVSYTIKSVPPGAAFSLDGRDAGSTPKTLQLSEGHHNLRFLMDGYEPADYALDIGPHDADGGGVTMELGGLNHDTVELRDGTSVSGDLLDVTANQVEVLVGGKKQTFERNQVKRILLVQRVPTGT